MMVHRVREPERPRDLTEFVTWIEHMNADMLAAGVEVGDRYDFDVVHGHDWLVASAGDHLAKRFRCPFVVTIHATEYGRHQGWVDKHPQSYIHGVERWMANRAERVITCSAYMREHVADIYGLEEERIAVIPNGIDPSELVPVDDLDTLRARFAEPDERLVLLVGRLVYEKGFQLALEALPGLIERVGNVRFLVAGSGTAEAELREQASELGLDEHGTFLGWIGDDVLHSLYRIADLTVVPSIYEPFGLVALEAMASGCPCLVADTGGLREVVPQRERGPALPLARPGVAGQMAERLLTDAALRDRLVAEASEHVLSFDWADVARQAGPLYGEARSLAAGSLKTALLAAALARAPVHAHRGGSVLDGVPSFAENTHGRPFATRAGQGYVLEMDVKLTARPRSCRVPRRRSSSGRPRAPARWPTGPWPAARLPRGRPRQPRGGLASRPAPRPSRFPRWPRSWPSLASEGAYVNLEIKNQPSDSDFDSGDGFAEDGDEGGARASAFPKDAPDRAELLAAQPRRAKARLRGVQTSLLTLAQANGGAPNFASVGRARVGLARVAGVWRLRGPRPMTSTARSSRSRSTRAADFRRRQRRRRGRPDHRRPRSGGSAPSGSRAASWRRTRIRPGGACPRAALRQRHRARPELRMRLAGEDRGSGVAGLTLETGATPSPACAGGAFEEPSRARPPLLRAARGHPQLPRPRPRPLRQLQPLRVRQHLRPARRPLAAPALLRGWRRRAVVSAYRRGLRRTSRRGASLRCASGATGWRSSRRRTRGGGRLHVGVAGRSRTVSLRGRPAARRVVFRSRALGPAIHRITVTAVGGGPVNVDAVALERGPHHPRC